jgi:hypothetical protein
MPTATSTLRRALRPFRALLARCSILIGIGILMLGFPRWAAEICRFEFARRKTRRNMDLEPTFEPVWRPDPERVRQIQLQLTQAAKTADRGGRVDN